MKEMKLNEFAAQTASDAPVPGGGSIAAVSGSLSAALSEMVANLTLGKKKYAEVEEEMKILAQKAKSIREKMLNNIEKDCDAFNKVMDSFKLPKGTDEEKAMRKKAIQSGLKLAAQVPFEIAQEAYSIMPLAETVVEKGNSNAITDGLVAAMMARTSVLSALLNVKINLESIKDESYVNEMTNKVKVLEEKVIQYEQKILSKSPF